MMTKPITRFILTRYDGCKERRIFSGDLSQETLDRFVSRHLEVYLNDGQVAFRTKANGTPVELSIRVAARDTAIGKELIEQRKVEQAKRLFNE